MKSLRESFFLGKEKLEIDPLAEGMYDGGVCPDCGAPLDDEGWHAQECPAKRNSSIRPRQSKRTAIYNKLIAKGMTPERAIAWLNAKGIA